MSFDPSFPGFAAARALAACLVGMTLCAYAQAESSNRASTPPATSPVRESEVGDPGSIPRPSVQKPPPTPGAWIVKVTPVYGNGLDRVEIRYEHRAKPIVLGPGRVQPILVRPTIWFPTDTGHACFGIDADLQWEGRCSVQGQWVAIDVDRSGPGLASANLRYDLRKRRLLVTSGKRQLHIDLTTGAVTGATSLLGECENVRDRFLRRQNEPLRIRVSDRPGFAGMVWIFPDLASVAVGPAEIAWFAQSIDAPTRPMPRDEPVCADSPPPLIRPARPHVDPAASLRKRRWSFASEATRAYRGGPVPCRQPMRLSRHPGKSLPEPPRARISKADAGRLLRMVETQRERWRQRERSVRHHAEFMRKAYARETGRTSAPPKGGSPPTSVIARASCAASQPSTTRPHVEALLDNPHAITKTLNELSARIDALLAKTVRAAEAARHFQCHAADMRSAERHCSTFSVGTSLQDEPACLMMDLSSEDLAPPSRRRAVSLIARRILGRSQDEILTRIWDRMGVLTTPPVADRTGTAWGRLPVAADEAEVEGIDLHRINDRAIEALASTLCADPLAARHFRRHLDRRYPDRMEITPEQIADLVADLESARVLEFAGLEQFTVALRGVQEERAAKTQEAIRAVEEAEDLAGRGSDLLDRLTLAVERASTGADQHAEAYRRAYAKQQNELASLIEWICRTYADPLFGRKDLSEHQRKRLLLSTAAWWARQWQMDLTWVDVDFDIEIERTADGYAWRIGDLRIDLLERPDPEAVLEERMARTPPPQAFPLGPMAIAKDRTVLPRTLADIPATTAAPVVARANTEQTPPAPKANDPSHAKPTNDPTKQDRPRMILPEGEPTIVSASDHSKSSDSPPSVPTSDGPSHASSPPVRQATMATSPRPSKAAEVAVGPEAVLADATVRDLTPPGPPMLLSSDGRALPARSRPAPVPARREPTRTGASAQAPARRRPGPARPAAKIQPALPDAARMIPVLLNDRSKGRTQRISVYPGQRIRLMGMVDFLKPPNGPVGVHVDLRADEPMANGLALRISPRPDHASKPLLLDEPPGGWWRRSIRWDFFQSAAEPFQVDVPMPRQFEGEDPTTARLTIALTLVRRDENQAGALCRQTVVLQLVPLP